MALGFAIASEVLVRWAVEPHDLLLRHREFMARASAADAVFGDSHASLGFTGVDGFVNLAFPGENLATAAGKARAYYRDRKPGRVILQADPSMLAPARDREPPTRYDNLDAGRSWLRILDERHRSRLTAYWRVWRSGEGFTTNRRFEADGAQTQSGRLADRPAAERDALALEEVLKQRPAEDPAASPGMAALSSLMAGLTQRGARICLVGFPMAPDYRRHAAARPAVQAARDAFAALAADHGVPYRDFAAAVDDPSLFLNADHLNRQGALQLAPEIVRACFGRDG